MNRKSQFVFLGALIFIIGISQAQEKVSDFPILKGPYLGQKPPGMTPELFAPGIISTEGVELCITFSKDGKECYFQRGRKIFVTREVNGKWIEPDVVSFSGKFPDGDPILIPDDSKLFFTSQRPVKNAGKEKQDTDIWFVERINGKWSEPVRLGNHINTDLNERTPTIAIDGTLYFHVSGREDPCDLFFSKCVNNEYSVPQPVMDLNTKTGSEADAYISPAKEFILFLQNGICISFSDENDSWSKPISLKNKLGPEFENVWPRVSYDGKYLFFSSFRRIPGISEIKRPNIYWISFADLIKEMKLNNLFD